MGLYDSETYMHDLDITIESLDEVLKAIDGSSILITGASGLVCSPIVDLLFRSNRIKGTSIKLFLAGRNEERLKARFNNQVFKYVRYDATRQNEFPKGIDYIIHGASNSGPREIAANGIDTMIENFMGMCELLSYAADNKVKNTLYISSSEVYGKKVSMESLAEDEYGWVDILSPRSSYPSSKRAAETLCACFSYEHGIKTTVVRPGHIYGPTARRDDSHVSAMFSFAAADGNNLIMKSSGEQIRSWCYSLDCASSILTVLAKGKDRNAYNISNSTSIASIKDIAELLAEVAGVKLIMDEPTKEERKSFNPMMNSSLNGDKIQGLGWQGLFDARTGFEHTIKIIREARI